MSNERPLAVGDLCEVLHWEQRPDFVGRVVTVISFQCSPVVRRRDGSRAASPPDCVMVGAGWLPPHEHTMRRNWHASASWLRRIDPPSTDFTACEENFRDDLMRALKRDSAAYAANEKEHQE